MSKKRGRYDAMLKQLERTGEDQISLTDPDSRAMAAHTKVDVGYNVQIAVDAKHKLIVDEEVTNQVVDMGLSQATADPAREILEVERIDVVADNGNHLGFLAPLEHAANTRAQEVLENLGAVSPPKRCHKVITMANDGTIISMKNRERADAAR